eukprot:364899-Chlamydomonas_euryale.AAC.43
MDVATATTQMESTAATWAAALCATLRPVDQHTAQGVHSSHAAIGGTRLALDAPWHSLSLKSREQQQFNVQMTPMPPAATANPAHHLSTHSSRYACMPTDIHGQMQHGQPAYGQPATGYPAYTTTYRANAPAGFLPQGYPTASMSGMPPGTNAYPSIPAANLSRTASDVPMLSAKQ